MKTPKLFAALAIYVSLLASSCTTSTLAKDITTSPDGRFEFHLDPWISLHHFAYHFVREEESSLKLRGRVPLTESDRRALTPELRTACASLIPAYGPYIEGSLLFDSKTRGLAKMLLEGPDAVTDTSVREALTACMPAYKKDLWPRHRAASEQLLQLLKTQLETYEVEMARKYTEVFGNKWPDTAIRVDITPYANWAGAYTDNSPSHITMSSSDENISEEHAFEVLFHEAGHTPNFEEPILSAAIQALEATGLENDRYWHYVLFFVVGRMTTEVLGDQEYTPYAKAAGLTEREIAASYYQALEETWNAGGSFQENVLAAAQRVAEGTEQAGPE